MLSQGKSNMSRRNFKVL